MAMTEPKVALYDCRGNLADPGEGVFVHLNDYEALAARVQELEDDVREGVEAQVRYVAEITRPRELDWEL